VLSHNIPSASLQQHNAPARRNYGRATRWPMRLLRQHRSHEQRASHNLLLRKTLTRARANCILTFVCHTSTYYYTQSRKTNTRVELQTYHTHVTPTTRHTERPSTEQHRPASHSQRSGHTHVRRHTCAGTSDGYVPHIFRICTFGTGTGTEARTQTGARTVTGTYRNCYGRERKREHQREQER
jgi:hypothetical protein